MVKDDLKIEIIDEDKTGPGINSAKKKIKDLNKTIKNSNKEKQSVSKKQKKIDDDEVITISAKGKAVSKTTDTVSKSSKKTISKRKQDLKSLDDVVMAQKAVASTSNTIPFIGKDVGKSVNIAEQSAALAAKKVKPVDKIKEGIRTAEQELAYQKKLQKFGIKKEGTKFFDLDGKALSQLETVKKIREGLDGGKVKSPIIPKISDDLIEKAPKTPFQLEMTEINKAKEIPKLNKELLGTKLAAQQIGEEFSFINRETGKAVPKIEAMGKLKEVRIADVEKAYQKREIKDGPIGQSNEIIKEASAISVKNKELLKYNILSKKIGKDIKYMDISTGKFLSPEAMRTKIESVGALNSKVGALKKGAVGSFTDINRAMGALSFLFIGAAIAESIERMAISTVQSYMSITKGQTEMATGMTALSAHVEFLRFTLGQAIATALAPMLPMIFSIITGLSNWISKNPGLATFGLLTGYIAAKVATFAAQVILALAGLNSLTGGKIATGIASIGTKSEVAGGLVATAGKGFAGWAISAATIGAILLVAAIAYMIAKTFKEYPSLMEPIEKGAKGAKDIWKDVLNTTIQTFTGLEDINEAWIIISGTIAIALGGIMNFLMLIGTAIITIVQSIGMLFGILTEGAIRAIKGVLNAWNWALESVGIKKFKINTSGLDVWAESAKNFNDNRIDTIKTSWEKLWDNIQTPEELEAGPEKALADYRSKRAKEKLDGTTLIPSIDIPSETDVNNLVGSLNFNDKNTPIIPTTLGVDGVFAQDFKNSLNELKTISDEYSKNTITNPTVSNTPAAVITPSLQSEEIKTTFDELSKIADDYINGVNDRIYANEQEAESARKLAMEYANLTLTKAGATNSIDFNSSLYSNGT